VGARGALGAWLQAFPSSLEEYTDKGLDLFGLEVHFCNWRAGAPGYEIVMVK